MGAANIKAASNRSFVPVLIHGAMRMGFFGFGPSEGFGFALNMEQRYKTCQFVVHRKLSDSKAGTPKEQ